MHVSKAKKSLKLLSPLFITVQPQNIMQNIISCTGDKIKRTVCQISLNRNLFNAWYLIITENNFGPHSYILSAAKGSLRYEHFLRILWTVSFLKKGSTSMARIYTVEQLSIRSTETKLKANSRSQSQRTQTLQWTNQNSNCRHVAEAKHRSANESWLTSVLFLIGWESSASF